MNDKSANTSEISGVAIFPIKHNKGRTILASEHDQLLRRFGQVEIVANDGINPDIFTIRSNADEFWIVIESKATFTLVDTSSHSPSKNMTETIEISSDEKRGLLIPFGIAYLIEVQQDTSLVRFTTHADGTHPEDQQIPKSDLSRLIAN